MSQIQNVTQQSAAIAEQCASSAEEMSAMAQTMSSAVVELEAITGAQRQ